MNTQRKNITQPADWWEAFKVQAKAEGLTLSEWAGACMLANVAIVDPASLGPRPPAHRPRKSGGDQ